MSLGDSIKGCLLGGAIGDAFGSAYEGQFAPVRFDDNSPWSLTDDTQLALATCEAITLAGKVDAEAIAKQMTAWFRQNRVTRLGSGTLKALRELSQGAHWALCGRRGEMAAGCGPAARIAPLAFWLDPTETGDRHIIRDVTRITHHSDEAYAGALAILFAIRAATTRAWHGKGDLARLILPSLPDTKPRDRLTELAALNQALSIPSLAARYGSSGYVVEAVPLAIYAADRVLTDGFFPVLCSLVSAGGDTDTIAALTGQISGTLIGVGGLPAEKIDLIPKVAEINRIATDFISALDRRS